MVSTNKSMADGFFALQTLSDEDRIMTKKSETQTVRLQKAHARLATIIAAHLDLSVPEYLAKVLQPILERDYEQIIADLPRSIRKVVTGKTTPQTSEGKK